MIPAIALRRAFADPQLLGTVLAGPSWRPWRVLLLAMMGEPLDDSERAVFKTLTGRSGTRKVQVPSASAAV